MMRLRKEKNKKFSFSWVDLLIILAVLGICFLGGRYLLSRYRASDDSISVTYTLTVSDIDAKFADVHGGWEYLIPIGSAVRSANGTASLGSVASLSFDPHTVATVRDGKVVMLEMPDRFDLSITVRAQGELRSGDGIRVSDIRIAAGERGDFRIGNLSCAANIVFVKREVEG